MILTTRLHSKVDMRKEEPRESFPASDLFVIEI